MKRIITDQGVKWHPDIAHFRLEPLVDLNASRVKANCVIGYEVLSHLRDGLTPELWFSQLSGRQQINILRQQIYSVSGKINDTCFYNLSVEGFLRLVHCDIEDIASYSKVCLEVADSSVLKNINEKERYIFFKNVSRLRYLGVGVWIDDFSINDLISLPAYKDNVDGIKIDKSEIHGRHLKDIINIIKQLLNGLPVLVEGVESERDLNAGMKSGADIAQGYYWGRDDLIVA
ncbi:EAL domain-containing protein [Kluyvera cryocrescens]|uniref:EAL domain-containing protein n=1 Tax=Kluyvera cryocrescens TaxID=580 RepID=UPI0039F6EEC1